MTPDQECALRVSKELLKAAVKTLEPAFPENPLEVCQPCLRALDAIDRRLTESEKGEQGNVSVADQVAG